MRNFSLYILIISFCFGCQQENHSTITVNGTIKNSSKNKIALISFGATNAPVILDTATLDSKGRFTLKSLTNDEELYAVKIDSMPEIWFVNDTKEITINANLKEYKSYQTIGSTASQALHHFISKFDSLIKIQQNIDAYIDTLNEDKQKDSLVNVVKDEKKSIKNLVKDYCINAVANTTSPALKYFFLYYIHKTNSLEETEVYRMVVAAQKQFPKHPQMAYLYSSLNTVVKENPKLFLINEVAFDFSLMDTAINKITLKTFGGKYLLMNFYESSNKQNTILAELYNQYKEKQFEVLNVSLDSNRQVWLRNIKKDSTGWKNVIDTARFNSTLAKKYYISSLPYNVLINPTGKIIAIDLSEEELREKLKELLK